ncbi:ketohexokinase-like [Liolophura sinensis]|uniref:ketohexokinase-like n=1 Tax=Liolophura sinensis TaxID=3198878 RepID=UPI0031581988
MKDLGLVAQAKDDADSSSSNKEKRIFCAGLLCLDIISICKEFPQEDSDQRCIERFWQRGGNASNNTTVLSILGVPCEFFGTIAKSHEVLFFTSDFEKNGIHIENCVYHANHSCSTSFVIINVQNGSRTIINSNKSLPDLTFQDFKTKVDLNSGLYKWMHFEGRPAAAEIKKMLAYVDDYNASVGESKRITTSVELEKPRPQLGMLFNTADYVFVSKDYARHHGYDNKEDALNAFFTRIRPGATLILPWGEHGAVAMKKEGEIIYTPAFPPESIVDTLGAGDTFIASTIYNISNGIGLREAITFGCKLAGAKVGMNGFMGLKKKLEAMRANSANCSGAAANKSVVDVESTQIEAPI